MRPQEAQTRLNQLIEIKVRRSWFNPTSRHVGVDAVIEAWGNPSQLGSGDLAIELIMVQLPHLERTGERQGT